MARRGFRSYFRRNKKSKMTLSRICFSYLFPVIAVVGSVVFVLGHYGYLTINK